MDTKGFEVHAIIEDGKISPHEDELCVGLIHNVEWLVVTKILEDLENLHESISEIKLPPVKKPDTRISATFKVFNIQHVEGQMSFPETGQWDFLPHWEYDVELIFIERLNNQQKGK